MNLPLEDVAMHLGYKAERGMLACLAMEKDLVEICITIGIYGDKDYLDMFCPHCNSACKSSCIYHDVDNLKLARIEAHYFKPTVDGFALGEKEKVDFGRIVFSRRISCDLAQKGFTHEVSVHADMLRHCITPAHSMYHKIVGKIKDYIKQNVKIDDVKE
jgi:hypothetical protein